VHHHRVADARANQARRRVGSPALRPGGWAIDARIRQVADRQRGVITRQQMLGDLNLKTGAIERRLAGGQLVRVHSGVYRLGGKPVPLSWAIAAALACGDGAVVSGRSAAALHEIGTRGPRAEVTAPGNHRHAAIRCHVARLGSSDVTVRLGIPVTTLARTVFDVAANGDYPGDRLADLVNRARIARPRLLAELDRLIARMRGRGWSAVAERRLRPLIADANGPVRSVFEQEFREALARSELPPAQFNVRVEGMEVDVLWPGAAFVVELDGRAYHDGEAAFEEDRERDARLIALHYAVIRLTWRRWRTQPDAELRRFHDIILGRTGS
jgi:very-short-patch-repair endonuclease